MADFTPKKQTSEKGKEKGGTLNPHKEESRPPTMYLGHAHLVKLGITKMPPVGSKIKISGLAHVGATSEQDDSEQPGDKKQRSMTLHMHKMDVGRDETDHEESQKAGMKAAVDKALTKGAGSESEGNGENS
jgi:hypothetical protein